MRRMLLPERYMDRCFACGAPIYRVAFPRLICDDCHRRCEPEPAATPAVALPDPLGPLTEPGAEERWAAKPTLPPWWRRALAALARPWVLAWSAITLRRW